MKVQLSQEGWASERMWGTLAFRLTGYYTLAGLCLVFLATLSLYLVLLRELEGSTNLFLADKLNVLRTMLAIAPKTGMRSAKKWNWRQPPGNTSTFTYAFSTNGAVCCRY